MRQHSGNCCDWYPLPILQESLYQKKLHAVGIRIHHVKVLIITSFDGCGLGDRILLLGRKNWVTMYPGSSSMVQEYPKAVPSP
ncbi:hypothetical protein [Butyrivibrio proteoclasticus]|uniref:hypothetical protein n=1 Tax=Butyrivibrio proteoclasticus TaxID=43305 RepID=UPI0015A50FAA|nr:hypothetical protein [Butyrivibrio proteoclasticus]